MKLNDILRGGMLRGKRTYLVGIGMIVAAVTQYAAGDMPLAEMIPEVLNGLGFVFVRSAIERDS
jgi:hypothetical protein